MKFKKMLTYIIAISIMLSILVGSIVFLTMLSRGGNPSGPGEDLEVYIVERTKHKIFGENQGRAQSLTLIKAKQGHFIVRNKHDFISKWKNGESMSLVSGRGYFSQKFVCSYGKSKYRKCLKIINQQD